MESGSMNGIVLDTTLTDRDSKDSLLTEIVCSTVKLFKLLLTEEDPDYITIITCSVINEVFNRIDTETTWDLRISRLLPDEDT